MKENGAGRDRNWLALGFASLAGVTLFLTVPFGIDWLEANANEASEVAPSEVLGDSISEDGAPSAS